MLSQSVDVLLDIQNLLNPVSRNTMNDTSIKCPHCGSTDFDINLDDYDDGQVIRCGDCEKHCYVWVGRLVDADTYHESYCDSQASRRYEESAYGHDYDD